MRLEAKQEIAQRLVSEVQCMVSRQLALVAELEKGDHDTEIARTLLFNFERARANFRRSLDLLKSTRTL